MSVLSSTKECYGTMRIKQEKLTKPNRAKRLKIKAYVARIYTTYVNKFGSYIFSIYSRIVALGDLENQSLQYSL